MSAEAPSGFTKSPSFLSPGDNVVACTGEGFETMEVEYAVKSRGPGWTVAFTDGRKIRTTYRLYVTEDTPGAVSVEAFEVEQIP